MMNLAHIHLLINHVPTVGTIIGVGLFLLALLQKNDHLKRTSLAVLCAVALMTLPVYLTGRAAEESIKSSPGVSMTLIEAHQDAALVAFAFMMITGAFAWIALWLYRRPSIPVRALRWTMSAVLVLSVVTLTYMAQAANIGGEIRHPEIMDSQAAAATDGTAGTAGTEGVVDPAPGWFTASAIAAFVNTNPFVWSALETLHFIGLSFLFGAVLFVNVRMLGLMKNTSFAAVDLMPLGLVGFAINVITGMMFFIATPGQYMTNIAFHWKILFLLLGGFNILYLVVFDEVWTLKPGDDASLTAKVIAGSTLFLWVGVLYFGRMLPFLGNSF